mgnify:CR=1 FL=1
MIVTQDARGWTHLDWELEGVTPDTIDWHWANLEKSYFLWHPSQHIAFRWVVPLTAGGFLGAVHEASQLRDDGTRRAPNIRYEDIAALPREVQDLVVYDHVCVDAALNLKEEPDVTKARPLGYRVHQWQSCDAGVVGRSSAVSLHVTDKEAELREGRLWAAHAAEECGNWGVFLPELCRLWSVVPHSDIHQKVSLKVHRVDGCVRYVDLK